MTVIVNVLTLILVKIGHGKSNQSFVEPTIFSEFFEMKEWNRKKKGEEHQGLDTFNKLEKQMSIKENKKEVSVETKLER